MEPEATSPSSGRGDAVDLKMRERMKRKKEMEELGKREREWRGSAVEMGRARPFFQARSFWAGFEPSSDQAEPKKSLSQLENLMNFIIRPKPCLICFEPNPKSDSVSRQPKVHQTSLSSLSILDAILDEEL